MAAVISAGNPALLTSSGPAASSAGSRDAATAPGDFDSTLAMLLAPAPAVVSAPGAQPTGPLPAAPDGCADLLPAAAGASAFNGALTGTGTLDGTTDGTDGTDGTDSADGATEENAGEGTVASADAASPVPGSVAAQALTAMPPAPPAIPTSTPTSYTAAAAGQPDATKPAGAMSGGMGATSAATPLVETSARMDASAPAQPGVPNPVPNLAPNLAPNPAANPLTNPAGAALPGEVSARGTAGVSVAGAGGSLRSSTPATPATSSTDATSPASAVSLPGLDPAAGPAVTPVVTAAVIAPTAATTGAAATVPAAPDAPRNPFSDQLSRPVLRLAASAPGTHILTVRVNPDHLGPVTVQAHIGPDGVRLELFSSTDAGRAAVQAALPDLRRDLAGTGLAASLDLSDRGAPNPDPNPSGDCAGGDDTDRSGRGSAPPDVPDRTANVSRALRATQAGNLAANSYQPVTVLDVLA